MKGTKIEWAHHTFNPWWGCEKVSPACASCYAEAFARRTGHAVWGKAAPRRLFGEEHWLEPLKWNAEAEADGERRRVFCASMADVFEDRRDLVGPRTAVFDLIERTPMLDWLLLTKRPENMVPMTRVAWPDAWPTNAWAGTTAEDQQRVAERVPVLLAVPAAVRFVSAEPLLGPIDLTTWLHDSYCLDGRLAGAKACSCPRLPIPDQPDEHGLGRIDWIIVGGESGPGARPCMLNAALDIVEQCAVARVACFFKQAGARPNVVNGITGPLMEWARSMPARDEAEVRNEWPIRLRHKKGGDLAELPECLRIREFPR